MKHFFTILILLVFIPFHTYGKRVYFEGFDMNDGLSHNTVNYITQDSRGFIWFGTKDGLNRYDGNSFKVYRHASDKPYGIGNSQIRSVVEDTRMRMFVGTNSGLYVYEMCTDKFTRPLTDENGEHLNNAILRLDKDIYGNIWIVVEGKGIYCCDHKTGLITCRYDKIKMLRTMKSDNNGRIWFSCANDGLYYTDDGFNTVHPFLLADGKKILNNDIISSICFGDYNNIYIGFEWNGVMELNLISRKLTKVALKDKGPHLFVRQIVKYNDEELWIGTESGIYVYNLKNSNVLHLTSSRFDKYSLSDNSIHSMFVDDEGGMWIGSFFGGVNYLSRRSSNFDKYYYTNSQCGLNGMRVKEICSDNNGGLWVGTEDSGLYRFDMETGRFSFFEPSRKFTNIQGLMLDGDKLWVSTFSNGLKVIDTDDFHVRHYSSSMTHGRLFSNDVFALEKTNSGVVYIGTMHGLQYYRPETDDFGYVPQINGGKMVNDIMEDSNGNLWVATVSYGVYRYNPLDKSWNRYYHTDGNGKLPNNNVLSIFEDSNKYIWFTTQGYGFCRYDQTTDTFDCFNSSIGMPSDVVYQIVEDKDGYFWITTNDGLVLFDPESMKVERIYTTDDGLLSNQFNYRSSYCSEEGSIWFGCTEGMISFQPSDLLNVRNKRQPRILVTDFSLTNGQNAIGDDDSPLKKDITCMESVVLKHHQNSFKMKIANLTFGESKSQLLEYILQGHEETWNIWKGEEITYSSLPYGEYKFLIRIKGTDMEPVCLKIRIKPPYLKSLLAFFIYGILMVLAIYVLIRFMRNRNREKRQKAIDDMSVKKEKELHDEKIKFFTNITHEIRTPVALVKAPLENILERKDLDKDLEDDLRVMHKNTQRLLVLINQILDFEKIEKKGISMNVAEHNIVEIVEDTYSRFALSMRQADKNVSLVIPDREINARIDSEAFTKILSNLFSNALKYSEKEIRIELLKREDTFVVKVTNDGKVVPDDKRETIFMPFYRYGNEYEHTGTGIGLSLSRSLAELHSGSLVMDDDVNFNCFVLTMPTDITAEVAAENTQDSGVVEDVLESLDDMVNSGSNDKVILIVEDDSDMREFIQKVVSKLYKVVTAHDGEQALTILRKNNVSLIVSDIMMPNMDGVEFCCKVKEDIRTSHIPIVLLTAKTNIESKIMSMDAGADAYLEKPFSTSYLMSVIANQIASRQRLKEAFMENPLVTNSNAALSDTDSKFLTQLQKAINDNISNPDINMNDIARLLYMSRANFYNKIKGLMDMTPNEYLRMTRLKKASQLLAEGNLQINEICYMVGFSSTSYFSKCFYKQYGVLPKNYKKPDNN